jgi:hypothetical protein
MPIFNQVSRGRVKIGALQIGNGTLTKQMKYGSVSINPASIATVSRAATTFTVTGAAVGDMLVMSPPATLNDDLIFCGAKITGANTGTMYLYNPTGGPIDDGALTWEYLWFDLT